MTPNCRGAHKPTHWSKGRDSLVKALDDGRNLEFCWRVLQYIAGLYQRTEKIPFLVSPAYERQAMRDWLVALES